MVKIQTSSTGRRWKFNEGTVTATTILREKSLKSEVYDLTILCKIEEDLVTIPTSPKITQEITILSINLSYYHYIF